MALHDSPPARPTAAWISRYASGLLSSTPGLQPLDAVRLAMNASAGAAAGYTHSPPKPASHPGALQR
jgi:hypothetical protein